MASADSIPCGFDFPVGPFAGSDRRFSSRRCFGVGLSRSAVVQPSRWIRRRDGLPMISVAISTDDLDEPAQRVVEILQIGQQLRHSWPIPG